MTPPPQRIAWAFLGARTPSERSVIKYCVGSARRFSNEVALSMKKRHEEVVRCVKLIDDHFAQRRIGYRLTLRQLYHDREEVTGFIERLSQSIAAS